MTWLAGRSVLHALHGVGITCSGGPCFLCLFEKWNALVLVLLTCVAAPCGITEGSVCALLVRAVPQRLCWRSCWRSNLCCYCIDGNSACVRVLYVAAQTDCRVLEEVNVGAQ